MGIRRHWLGGLVVALAGAGCLGLLPGCAEAPEAAAPPNVVIYLVDTLRADHLGTYGYRRNTSPYLDQWAADGVVFETAYSPTSWTRPAMVSLFSGRDASSHRVEDRLDVIPDDVELLSERLRQVGYATYAAVTNPNVLPEWGFDRGFDEFTDLGSAGHTATADQVTDFLIDRLDELAANQPFLLYVHLIDPHAPYEPPAPFDTRFPRSPALPATMSIGHYDGEVAFVDEQFGRFADALDRHGLTEESLVVFTSDHGEELMDHGAFGHGGHLYEEVVRIPLIIRMPGASFGGTRMVSPVSLIDLAPTITGLAGQTMGPEATGRNLIDLLPAGPVRLWADRDLFLSLYTTGPASHAVQGVISGDHKYLRRTRPTAGEEVYDLGADPDEKRNLVRGETHGFVRLVETLDLHLAEHARGILVRVVSEPGATPETCEMTLTTTGRFTDVAPLRLEAGDEVTVADGGRQLRLSCRLVNREQILLAGSRSVPDEDGLAFRVEPDDAPIVVEHARGGSGRELPLRTGGGAVPAALPFTFRASAAALATRGALEMLGLAHTEAHPGPGAYLGVVTPPREAEEVPSEILERLRGLGYIQGDTSG